MSKEVVYVYTWVKGPDMKGVLTRFRSGNSGRFLFVRAGGRWIEFVRVIQFVLWIAGHSRWVPDGV